MNDWKKENYIDILCKLFGIFWIMILSHTKKKIINWLSWVKDLKIIIRVHFSDFWQITDIHIYCKKCLSRHTITYYILIIYFNHDVLCHTQSVLLLFAVNCKMWSPSGLWSVSTKKMATQLCKLSPTTETTCQFLKVSMLILPFLP